MANIWYVNGRYVPRHAAYIHGEDRGYQFADGIYEVIAFYNRTLLDADLHLARWFRSLKELSITPPMAEAPLKRVIAELMERNDRMHGTLYMQATRGVAKRDHLFPKQAKSSLVMNLTGPKMPKQAELENGVKVITAPEQRWARRDIKSTSLLANVLAKQAAGAAGAREAWLVDESGVVTEGSASNNAIVTKKGEIITQPLGNTILGGITRHVVLDIARKAQLKVIERPFTLKEALAAAEAFMTGTTTNVLPVASIDGKAIGKGLPGPVTRKLMELHHDHILRETGYKWS